MTENKGFLYKTLHAIENNLLGVIVGSIFLTGVGNWTHDMYSTHQKAQVEKFKIEKGLELKVGDYNGNEILDKFYEVNGNKIPYEVDGKSASDYFKQ